MFGTIVNALAVVAGSALGLLVSRALPKGISDVALRLAGVTVVIVGLNGVITSMITVNSDGTLESNGTIVLILSITIGGLIGEFLDIDGRFNRAMARVENKFGVSGFANGFVSASLLFCTGAMTIVGALNDGLSGDSSILLAKACIDGFVSVVLAATMGIGVMFSALFVLVYQGAIALSASFIAPLIQGELLVLICSVGYLIVFVVGLNTMKLTEYKTAKLLPALLGPLVYNLIMMLKNMW